MSDSCKPLRKLSRREILRQGLIASGVLAVGPALWGRSHGSPRAAKSLDMAGRVSNIRNLAGTLEEVRVENDPACRMRVPRGFRVREVARSGQRPAPNSNHIWHGAPDGGATFATEDGGWIYVSNSEMGTGRGGVGALRFAADGELVDSYSICSGTHKNCAGGPTPWGTWLTCEEVDNGLVYECDPSGKEPAKALPALGLFKHEAAAVDPVNRHIYLTEDTPDGNFYRFIPDRYVKGGRADLSSGRLEVAVVLGDDPFQSRPVQWLPIPKPAPGLFGKMLGRELPTRQQVAEAEKFDGGEGCWYHLGIVYFTTKGDNRVWALDTVSNRLDLIYDKQRDQAPGTGMADVDNVTVSSAGDILVAEDGAQMRLVVVDAELAPFQLLAVLDQSGSEICGPAFSPDGNRLYFSSQRGVRGDSSDGRTYEVRGPFFIDV